METFVGQLWDADHVVFDRVTGTAEARPENLAGSSGDFEIREGDASIETDREFRLVLEDGRSWPVRLINVEPSNSGGIARFEFEIADDPAAKTHLDSAGT